MTFDDMLPSVLPSCAGCPETLALDHLLRSARRFCSETLVWNYETPEIPASAGLAKYTLQINDGQNLVRLIRCEVDGRHYDVPPGMSGRLMQRQSSGHTCVVGGNNDITLNPAPHQDGLLIVTEVAVKPSLSDPSEWPDDLDEHVDDIAHGAIATLMFMPNQTWTDVNEAARREQRFKDRIGTVAFKVTKGFGRTRHGAKTRWF